MDVDLNKLSPDAISARAYAHAFMKLIDLGRPVNIKLVYDDFKRAPWWYRIVVSGQRIAVATRRPNRDWEPDSKMWQDADLVIGVDYSQGREATFHVIRPGDRFRDPASKDAFWRVEGLGIQPPGGS